MAVALCLGRKQAARQFSLEQVTRTDSAFRTRPLGLLGRHQSSAHCIRFALGFPEGTLTSGHCTHPADEVLLRRAWELVPSHTMPLSSQRPVLSYTPLGRLAAAYGSRRTFRELHSHGMVTADTALRRFLQTETASAALLLGAAIGALIWANVDTSSYDRCGRPDCPYTSVRQRCPWTCVGGSTVAS